MVSTYRRASHTPALACPRMCSARMCTTRSSSKPSSQAAKLAVCVRCDAHEDAVHLVGQTCECARAPPVLLADLEPDALDGGLAPEYDADRVQVHFHCARVSHARTRDAVRAPRAREAEHTLDRARRWSSCSRHACDARRPHRRPQHRLRRRPCPCRPPARRPRAGPALVASLEASAFSLGRGRLPAPA
jgi:hypothetical protein